MNHRVTTTSRRGLRRIDRPKKDEYLKILPFIITCATFLLTFGFQLWQWEADKANKDRQWTADQDAKKTDQDAQRDSEWRKALAHVSAKDSPGAIAAAYEMESFLNDPKYGGQARGITASLLPRVEDYFAFDEIFFTLLKKINQDNQNEIVSIDSMIAKDLRSLYEERFGQNRIGEHSQVSFGQFLDSPEQYFDASKESDKRRLAFSKAWELESVSHGLSELWRGQYSSKVTPTGQLLVDLTFYKNDFGGINFKGAYLRGVKFVGDCNVDKFNLPDGARDECTHADQEKDKGKGSSQASAKDHSRTSGN
jgi:hypothetical protein